MKFPVFAAFAAIAISAQSWAGSSFSIHSCYGDHMVLQRGKPVRIAGTATPGAAIKGKFRDDESSANADLSGNWVLEFPAGDAGGPFELTVTAKTSVTFRDVMVGEVWFCSGQSNMEYPVWSSGKFWGLPEGESVAADGDKGIRLFLTPHGVAPDAPCDEPPGRPAWRLSTDPAAVKPFSAVAWFFAKDLRKRLGPGVAIGLVESAWGGTLIQPWISEKTLARAGETAELARIREAQVQRDAASSDEARKARRQKMNEQFNAWLRDKYFGPFAEASAKALASWASLDLPADEAAQWKRGAMASGGGLDKVGVTWHRREFTLPEDWAGSDVVVRIDTIDDCDETFLDGVRIGETGTDTPKYWSVKRVYRARLQATEGGRHVLAIRQQNHFMVGRFGGPVTIEKAGVQGTKVALDGGEWAERVEFHVDPKFAGVRPQVPNDDDVRTSQQTASTLFNAMVRPYVCYPMRGAIWYQGCSNAGAPAKYRDFQREIVEDWREAWNDPSFVFIGTQLSAFRAHHPAEPFPDDFWKNDAPGSNVGYAPIRDSQTVLFDIPGCGLACTIDVGNPSDIHPSRKREVGERLANEAMRLAYGDTTALPGPRGASAKANGAGTVRVTLGDIGEGVEMRGAAACTAGQHMFALFGADGKGEWADSRIDGDGTVVVSAAGVEAPVRVDYAWCAYPPEPCLYRKGDGIPVFPFRLNVVK